MSRAPSQHPDDPFDGLLLPLDAWKALEDAKITSLEQLKTVAPQLEQIRSIDPETAQVIQNRLERLTFPSSSTCWTCMGRTHRRQRGVNSLPLHTSHTAPLSRFAPHGTLFGSTPGGGSIGPALPSVNGVRTEHKSSVPILLPQRGVLPLQPAGPDTETL
jgi:hypothetical protein